MPTRWEQARAALIALHLMAITAIALPTAGAGLNRSAWKNPTVQEEFTAWTHRLNVIGIDLDQAQVEDLAFHVASGWSKLQHSITRPFQPYYRYCGTNQSWRMFVAPHRYPARLHIDIDEGEGFRPLYEARSPTHRWRGHQLDQDRFRSLIFRYGWAHVQRAGHYDSFVRWLAKQAATDFPEAVRIRVRFYVYRTPSPEQVHTHTEPTGAFKAVRITRLERFR